MSLKVKEWMKNHKEEVERIQKRCDELKELSLQNLLNEASLTNTDADKIKGILIATIIASEGK